jgi:3-isopropylmalate dehydratase small subunit
MKKLAALLCGLFVLAVLAAPVSVAIAAEKTHDVKGTVVSVDLTANTLTFKDDTGQNKTVPALGKAIDSLKTLKAGDNVTLTCTDNEKGEHQGISKIKVEKPPAQ